MAKPLGEEKKLDALPRSDSTYFTDYKAEVTKTVMSQPPKCEHNFIMTGKALEVECTKCHIGFKLDKETILKDGHIYRLELVV